MNPEFFQTHRDNFKYLFELRDSGRTNMFGAANYLQSERGLDLNTAKTVLGFWMTYFQEIATELNVKI